jgi:hypothetical protein
MIKELRRDYPVRFLCRVLAVSRSGFHAWLVRQPSARARARERLKVAALAAHMTDSGNVEGTVSVVRLGEFLADTQRIGQGVAVNVGDWERQLESNKQAYALEFVLRQRFLTVFPLSMTPEQFVDKLARNAGITLQAGDRSALIAQLNSSADVAAGRAAVLRAVAENQQLRDNEFRRAFVLMQYFGYLRRNPDDPQDTDFRGRKFWLGKLNQFNGDFVRAEMV